MVSIASLLAHLIHLPALLDAMVKIYPYVNKSFPLLSSKSQMIRRAENLSLLEEKFIAVHVKKDDALDKGEDGSKVLCIQTRTLHI